jgi:hypothetical protein
MLTEFRFLAKSAQEVRNFVALHRLIKRLGQWHSRPRRLQSGEP